MPTRYIYTQPAAESSLSKEGGQERRETSTPGALTGSPSARGISLEAGQRSLDGVYRGDDAQVMVEELRGLFAAPGYEAVPIWTTGDGAQWEGYYVLERVNSSPEEPQAQATLQNYRGVVRQKGTRQSHWRAVGTSKGQVANDFGGDQVTRVAAPASASLVRWWDGDAAVEEPAPIATRSGQHGDVEIYDVDAASFATPTLLFDIPYDAEYQTDCVVWDTRGLADREDASGDVQWRRVFSPTHDPDEFVLSNRLLRLTLDDEAETITAERWSSGSWTTEDLGTSGWAPVDVDVRTIAPARLEARILWSDGSERYPLDLILARGAADALWVRTPNADSATPSTLVDYLAPIASETIYDAGAEQALVAREEVSE